MLSYVTAFIRHYVNWDKPLQEHSSTQISKENKPIEAESRMVVARKQVKKEMQYCYWVNINF